MGVYADTLAETQTLLNKEQWGKDVASGSYSGNRTIYVYASDASSGDAAVYTYTGPGGYAQMLSEWRTANASVTSGDMFDLWTEWNGFTDSQKNTEIDRHTAFITYYTRKIAHLQAIVDNGEDPTGLSLEDMADIEALKPE